MAGDTKQARLEDMVTSFELKASYSALGPNKLKLYLVGLRQTQI